MCLKKVFFSLFFFIQVNQMFSQQGAFNIGWNMAEIHDKAYLDGWAEEWSTFFSSKTPILIPTYTKGYVLGIELFRESGFNTGILHVRNVGKTEFIDRDIFGNDEPKTFRIKYNYWEIPFFFFPGNRGIGFGTAMDIGKVKIQSYTPADKLSPFYHFNKSPNLAFNSGVKLRFSHENIGFYAYLGYTSTLFPLEGFAGNSPYEFRFEQIVGRVGIYIKTE